MVSVRVEAVAPEIGVPFLNHWIVGAGVPVKATLNVAELPVTAVTEFGAREITGAELGAAETVIVAVALVTGAPKFVN